MHEDKRCRPVLFQTSGPEAGEQEPFPVGPNVRPRAQHAPRPGERDRVGSSNALAALIGGSEGKLGGMDECGGGDGIGGQ
jgi:hypothetical protein